MHEIKPFKASESTNAVAVGQFILQAGEPGNCACVLLEGEAEVFVNGAVVEHAKSGQDRLACALRPKNPSLMRAGRHFTEKRNPRLRPLTGSEAGRNQADQSQAR
jgi:hypothetical protein